MTKGLAFLDYAVIAAFFAVMIGVGVYCSRKWMDGLERS